MGRRKSSNAEVAELLHTDEVHTKNEETTYHQPPCRTIGEYTITIVICEIMEVVIKTSVTDTLRQAQHYLQRGFTEGVCPIYAAFLVHELQNEASDLKLPLYVGYLDAEAAFDTVWIGSLNQCVNSTLESLGRAHGN